MEGRGGTTEGHLWVGDKDTSAGGALRGCHRPRRPNTLAMRINPPAPIYSIFLAGKSAYLLCSLTQWQGINIVGL